jgi:hypothetical protein
LPIKLRELVDLDGGCASLPGSGGQVPEGAAGKSAQRRADETGVAVFGRKAAECRPA